MAQKKAEVKAAAAAKEAKKEAVYGKPAKVAKGQKATVTEVTVITTNDPVTRSLNQ